MLCRCEILIQIIRNYKRSFRWLRQSVWVVVHPRHCWEVYLFAVSALDWVDSIKHWLLPRAGGHWGGTGKPLGQLAMPELGSKGPELDGSTLQALCVANEGAQIVRADW